MGRQGLTLIEILVVLAILAVALPGFLALGVYINNLNNVARLRQGANFLAQRLAEELPLTPTGGQPDTGSAPPTIGGGRLLPAMPPKV